MSCAGSRDVSVGQTREEEEEEDFLPAIPESLLHSLQTCTATTHALSGEMRPQKRSRSPSEGSMSCGGAADHLHHTEDNSSTEKNSMELLNAEECPSASLYERSYRHEHAICDIGVVHDENGILIATVDLVGTLRAWRKLPRGVFFMGENHGLFPSGLSQEGEVKNGVRHYILVDSLTSTLLVVRVTTRDDVEACVVTVTVEVRWINPTILRVEGRISFCFNAVMHNTSTHSSSFEDILYSRPFLLHHDYQPLITFFTAQRGEGGCVVMVPCVSERTSHPAAGVYSGNNSNGIALAISSPLTATVPCLPLSTANPVVCCQQHRPSGLVVLVDKKGIVDYARITAQVGDDVQLVVSLQVVAGVPRSPKALDPMMLRQWINFERRQKTGFFTLLREMGSSEKTGRSMMPLSVAFSTTGRYFVVVSCVLREGYACVCAHVFEFVSGAFLCRGETEETAVPSLQDVNGVQAAFRAMRGVVMGVVVEDAVRKTEGGVAGGVWVFLPEFPSFTAPEGRVWGRCITVFRASPVVIPPQSDPSTTRFLMERLPHPIGYLEKCVRETALPAALPPRFFLDTAKISWNIATPLVLLRVAVRASQSLKNLLAQSHLGSDLSLEDLKRLLVAPGTINCTGARDAGSGIIDPIFCTTSLEGKALIMYTRYEAQLGNAILDTNYGSSSAETDVIDTKTGSELSGRLLSELREKRDFDCAHLMQIQSSVERVLPLSLLQGNEGRVASTEFNGNEGFEGVQEE